MKYSYSKLGKNPRKSRLVFQRSKYKQLKTKRNCDDVISERKYFFEYYSNFSCPHLLIMRKRWTQWAPQRSPTTPSGWQGWQRSQVTGDNFPLCNLGRSCRWHLLTTRHSKPHKQNVGFEMLEPVFSYIQNYSTSSGCKMSDTTPLLHFMTFSCSITHDITSAYFFLKKGDSC